MFTLAIYESATKILLSRDNYTTLEGLEGFLLVDTCVI